MALSSATVWEVRPTVGSDTNGGGFIAGASGTDYSQQNSAEYSGTDLTIDASSNNVVASASHNFVAADVGNLIMISAGSSWNQGWYQIVSCASNEATLDRSPGSTSLTGGTWAVGGALNSALQIYSNTSNNWPVTSGQTMWIKSTGTLTSSNTMNLAGISGLLIAGYNTTRGDGTLGCVLWTTSTTNHLFELGWNNTFNVTVQNIHLQSTNGSPADGMYSQGNTVEGIIFDHCVFDGFRAGINSSGDDSGGNGFNNLASFCEFKNCAEGAWIADNYAFNDCYFHNNSTAGLYIQSNHGAYMSVVRCVFAANDYGIYYQDTQAKMTTVDHCCFWSNTGDGISIGNSSYGLITFFLSNSIFYGNGGYGIDAGSPTSWAAYANVLCSTNAFGSNTSGNRHYFPYGSSTDLTLTADPFTSGSTGDFSLNTTSGGGAVCAGAAGPASIFGTSTANVGAVQSSGGGSSPVTTGYAF